MAQFGANVTETSPIGVASTVKEGVREAPPAMVQALSNVFEGAGEIMASRKQGRQEGFLAEFTNTQLGIVEATDQGTYKPQYARTLLRKNLIEAINNYPGLREELIQANSSILGQAGMGSVVTEEDRETQERNRARDNLITQGLLQPGASDEEFVRSQNQWVTAQEAQRRYQLESQDISMQRAKIGLTTDQINLLDRREQAAAEQLLIDTAPAELNAFQTFTTNLQNRSDLSTSEKLIALEQQWIQMQAESARWEGRVSDHFATSMRKAFEQQYNLTKGLIDGSMDQAVATAELNRIQTTLDLKLFQNPIIANAYATSKIFPNANLPLIPDVQAEIARIFLLNNDPSSGEVANPFAVDARQRQILRGYMGALEDVDTEDPEVQQEVMDNLQSLILGIEDYSSLLARDPKAGIELMNQMADPKFLELMKANPEIAANASRAREVIAQNYSNEVWGMVQREFTNNNVISLEGDLQQGPYSNPMTQNEGITAVVETPTPDAVTYRPTAMGVEFIPVDPSNSAAVTKSRDLNRKLAPVINRTVQATAHLEGREDYSKVFEEAATLIFGSKGTDKPAYTLGEDLELGDFHLGGALDMALTTGGFVGNGDYSQEETAADVAAAFIGFREAEHRNILSAFIERTTGGRINPETTAWCAAFVNAALGAVGEEQTGKLTARSFLNWGQPVSSPKRGDVVVLARGTEAWQGHVGFYVGEDANSIFVLGGNQGNAVSIQPYPKDQLLGIRRGRVAL